MVVVMAYSQIPANITHTHTLIPMYRDLVHYLLSKPGQSHGFSNIGFLQLCVVIISHY